MEPFPVYKLPPLSKPDLFVPPPYCRRAEKAQNETEELPSLKLTVSNPSRLLLLAELLIDDSSKALEAKLNTYLMKHGESKMVFLLHLLPCSEEAILQTLGTTELENALRWNLSEKFMTELLQYQSKAFKCDEESSFQLVPIFNQILGTLEHRTIIGVPILKRQTTCPPSTQGVKPVLLTCFVDSKKNEDTLIALSNELFKYFLPLVLNTMAAEEEARQKLQYQTLLSVLQKLITSIDDVNLLVKTMTEETRKLMKAQHGTLYLKDANHADILPKVLSSFSPNKLVAKVKKAQDYETTQMVAATGKIINAVSPLSDGKLVQDTKYEIKNILCFPIRDDDGIIGAMKVCNKGMGNFNRFDEEIATILDIVGGSIIKQSVNYAKNANARIRSGLSDGVMLQRIIVEEGDVEKILSCRSLHFYKDFGEFKFSPRVVAPTETACFVLQMFEKLHFFSKFAIDRKIFANFVVSVRNGCHPASYHNWMHLFSTAHFAYLCLKNLKLVEEGYVSDIEALAYFLSCLCHGVDYRGHKNPFQEDTETLFESLYSSPGSVVQRHSLSQMLRILNSEGCNFLKLLRFEEYHLVIQLLQDFCVGTDLAKHFKLYKRQYRMVKDGYQRENPEHRFSLMSLLMTCADLSDHVKDWATVKEVVGLIYEEFVEKDNHQKKPPLLSDLEVELLREACLPAFKLVRAMFPEFGEIVAQIKMRVLYWECSKHIFQKGVDEGTSCLEILKSKDFDKAIEAAVDLISTQNKSN